MYGQILIKKHENPIKLMNMFIINLNVGLICNFAFFGESFREVLFLICFLFFGQFSIKTINNH